MTFNEQHSAYLARCQLAVEQWAKKLFMDESTVSQAALYSLLNGGKRVRGVITLAVCDLLDGNGRAAEAFAAALEMVHAFSLVHDDLPCMDNDDLRRGKPACHIAFGESTALLAGDLLCIQAFETAASAPTSGEAGAQAVRVLAAAAGAKGMIYGQELDLVNEKRTPTQQELEKTHIHKTGALLLAAVQLGQVAAGALQTEAGPLKTYARNVGQVFQIVDDILDVTADADALGKPLHSDEKSGKSTYVSLWGLEEARRAAQTLTDEAVQRLGAEYGEKAEFLCEFARQLARRAH